MPTVRRRLEMSNAPGHRHPPKGRTMTGNLPPNPQYAHQIQADAERIKQAQEAARAQQEAAEAAEQQRRAREQAAADAANRMHWNSQHR